MGGRRDDLIGVYADVAPTSAEREARRSEQATPATLALSEPIEYKAFPDRSGRPGHKGDWRVEAIDMANEGVAEVAIFCGWNHELRAKGVRGLDEQPADRQDTLASCPINAFI